MFSKLDNICHQDLLIVARFMIARDQCGSWFHGSCVGINEDMATSMETENIPLCALNARSQVYLKNVGDSFYRFVIWNGFRFT